MPDDAQLHPTTTLYLGAHSDLQGVIRSSFSGDLRQVHSNSHAGIEDFTTWFGLLRQRHEILMLQTAIQAYSTSLMAVSAGFYRSAFFELRLFFEHSLGAVYFSTNELEFRLWMNGEADVTWAKITDSERGIFSKPFARAFFPSLEESVGEYNSLAKHVYRECSEYVHCNPTVEIKIPETLTFNEELCKSWHTKAATIRFLVHISFAIRHLKSLNPTQTVAMSHVLNDELGHLAAFRI